MSRRAVGITPVKREDKPLYVVKELPMAVDVTSPEVKRQEKEDAFSRQISIASQALFCFAIILLFLNIINQVVKLCF